MEERLPEQNTGLVNEDGALQSADASAAAENEAQTVATDDAGRIALAAYTPNEDYYTETIFLQTIRKRRVLRLGGIVLVLLSGIQMTRNAPEMQRFMLLGALSLAGLFFFLYAQFAHIFKGKAAIRKIRKRAGGADLPQLVHEYYPDRISIHAEQSDNARTYPFSEVTEIRQTKDLTLFVFGSRYSIAVPHRAFRFGSAQKVREYIKANYKLKRLG